MMKGHGRRIVVDADVGCGAADAGRADRGEPVDARALSFSRSLNAMYKARHVAVFSPTLRDEWRQHVVPGSSGHRWFTRMAERRLVTTVDPEPDATWLEDLIGENLSEADGPVAQKDRHLVATAIAEADARLISGDRKAREKYTRLARWERRIADLHWVDPSWEGVRDWLLNRAPDHPEWTLTPPPP